MDAHAANVIKTLDDLAAKATTSERRYDTLAVRVEDWQAVSAALSNTRNAALDEAAHACRLRATELGWTGRSQIAAMACARAVEALKEAK